MQPRLKSARIIRLVGAIAQDQRAVHGVNVLRRQADVLAELANTVIAFVRRVDVAVDEVAAALRVGDPTDISDGNQPTGAGIVRRKLLLRDAGIIEQTRSHVEGLQRPLRVDGLTRDGERTAPIRERGAITDTNR